MNELIRSINVLHGGAPRQHMNWNAPNEPTVLRLKTALAERK